MLTDADHGPNPTLPAAATRRSNWEALASWAASEASMWNAMVARILPPVDDDPVDAHQHQQRQGLQPALAELAAGGRDQDLLAATRRRRGRPLAEAELLVATAAESRARPGADRQLAAVQLQMAAVLLGQPLPGLAVGDVRLLELVHGSGDVAEQGADRVQLLDARVDDRPERRADQVGHEVREGDRLEGLAGDRADLGGRPPPDRSAGRRGGQRPAAGDEPATAAVRTTERPKPFCGDGSRGFSTARRRSTGRCPSRADWYQSSRTSSAAYEAMCFMCRPRSAWSGGASRWNDGAAARIASTWLSTSRRVAAVGTTPSDRGAVANGPGRAAMGRSTAWTGTGHVPVVRVSKPVAVSQTSAARPRAPSTRSGTAGYPQDATRVRPDWPRSSRRPMSVARSGLSARTTPQTPWACRSPATAGRASRSSAALQLRDQRTRDHEGVPELARRQVGSQPVAGQAQERGGPAVCRGLDLQDRLAVAGEQLLEHRVRRGRGHGDRCGASGPRVHRGGLAVVERGAEQPAVQLRALCLGRPALGLSGERLQGRGRVLVAEVQAPALGRQQFGTRDHLDLLELAEQVERAERRGRVAARGWPRRPGPVAGPAGAGRRRPARRPYGRPRALPRA